MEKGNIITSENQQHKDENQISCTYGGEIVIYHPDETISLEVKLDNDTVWLTQAQIAELFGVKQPAISKHLGNIFREGELDKNLVHSILEYTAADGKVYRTQFYNLDAILSVGYRVNSANATRFRQWANQVLKEYILRGYSVNKQMVAMQERTDERFLSIENRLDRQQEQVDFLVRTHQQPTEEIFASGCIWDAYSFLANLIRTAKKQIVLVDNYCNDKTLTLLDERPKDVSLTIYTTFNKAFNEAVDAYNSQNPLPRHAKKVQLPLKIHDRFLIIDDDVYLLGNSLKDIGHTLSAVIKTGFSVDEILLKLRSLRRGQGVVI